MPSIADPYYLMNIQPAPALAPAEVRLRLDSMASRAVVSMTVPSRATSGGAWRCPRRGWAVYEDPMPTPDLDRVCPGCGGDPVGVWCRRCDAALKAFGAAHQNDPRDEPAAAAAVVKPTRRSRGRPMGRPSTQRELAELPDIIDISETRLNRIRSSASGIEIRRHEILVGSYRRRLEKARARHARMKVKASTSHLACGVCLAKVDPALVAEFCEKARTKRGAPSYYAARKRLIAALRVLHPVKP